MPCYTLYAFQEKHSIMWKINFFMFLHKHIHQLRHVTFFLLYFSILIVPFPYLHQFSALFWNAGGSKPLINDKSMVLVRNWIQLLLIQISNICHAICRVLYPAFLMEFFWFGLLKLLFWLLLLLLLLLSISFPSKVSINGSSLLFDEPVPSLTILPFSPHPVKTNNDNLRSNFFEKK